MVGTPSKGIRRCDAPNSGVGCRIRCNTFSDFASATGCAHVPAARSSRGASCCGPNVRSRASRGRSGLAAGAADTLGTSHSSAARSCPGDCGGGRWPHQCAGQHRDSEPAVGGCCRWADTSGSNARCCCCPRVARLYRECGRAAANVPEIVACCRCPKVARLCREPGLYSEPGRATPRALKTVDRCCRP